MMETLDSSMDEIEQQEPQIIRWVTVTLAFVSLAGLFYSTFGLAWYYAFFWVYTTANIVFMLITEAPKVWVVKKFSRIYLILTILYLSALAGFIILEAIQSGTLNLGSAASEIVGVNINTSLGFLGLNFVQ